VALVEDPAPRCRSGQRRVSVRSGRRQPRYARRGLGAGGPRASLPGFFGGLQPTRHAAVRPGHMMSQPGEGLRDRRCRAGCGLVDDVWYHVGIESTGMDAATFMPTWALHGINGTATTSLCGKPVDGLTITVDNADWEKVRGPRCSDCLAVLNR
jgi:hypothetical protein